MYMPPPPPPPPAPPRTRTMMWVGIALLVLSLGSCVTGVVTAGKLVYDAAKGTSRIQMNTPTRLTLGTGDVGTVLGFGSTREEASAPEVRVLGPDERPVATSTFPGRDSQSNQIEGRTMVPLATFEATTPGTYTTTATGPPGATIAVIKFDPSDLAVRLVGGLGVGFVLLVVGIVLVVVGARRR